MKKLFKFISSRLFVSFLLIFLQVGVVFYFTYELAWGFRYFFTSSLVGFLLAFMVFCGDSNPSYKIAWIMLILAVPIFGCALYFLFGNKKLRRWGQRKIRSYREITQSARFSDIPKNQEVSLIGDSSVRRQSEYISTVGEYQPFSDTRCTYFSLGDRVYPVMMEKLREAKRFIMMEFFIYEAGEMWNPCLEILKQKVDEGVEVFLMYDDMGSINTVSANFDKVLCGMGIKAIKFNPVRLRANARLNYRDHRKICIIDGNTAFNGGINFADEYINRKIRFGHWKDTAIMLEGTGVWNYTLMFLQLWSFADKSKNPIDEVTRYFPTETYPSQGIVQPFGDSPLDNVNVSENAYLQMICQATRYVWITTPYLILDNEMISALSIAASSGIDVRIITPHYADKVFVHAVTRSNYERLVSAGVKIYEYTPGFIHSKLFISDDKVAIVGTANMDYRSFYLHFECGSLIYNSPCLEDIRKDYLETVDLSQQITKEEIDRTNVFVRLVRQILNLAAPLL